MNVASLDALAYIADLLQDRLDEITFVGGVVVPCYATRPLSTLPRPTTDIDSFVNASFAEYAAWEELLRAHGFRNDIESKIICRYILEEDTLGSIKFDLMSTAAAGQQANQWYKMGFPYRIKFQLTSKRHVYILSAPYFLATKLEAHFSRGTSEEEFMSKDFEDIVYVIDHRAELVNEVELVEPKLRAFIQQGFQLLQASPSFMRSLEYALGPQATGEDLQEVAERCSALAQ